MGKGRRQARSRSIDFEASAPLGSYSRRNEYHAFLRRSATLTFAGNQPRAVDAACGRYFSRRRSPFIRPSLLSGPCHGFSRTCACLVQAICTFSVVGRCPRNWAWPDVLASLSQKRTFFCAKEWRLIERSVAEAAEGIPYAHDGPSSAACP